MTTLIATNVTSNGDSNNVKVDAGRYMFAIGGDFDGATVVFNVTIGSVTRVPVADMTYTTAKADIVWLPSCTVNITVTAAGASTDIDAAVAPVLLDVQ